jgi:DNA repair protein RadC
MNTRTLKKHLQYKIPQIRLALIRERDVRSVTITTPDDLSPYLEPLKHFSEEHFVSYHLSSPNQVIGYHVVSHGTVSASLVHPREVFKAALLGNSHGIIVAHNHPGGSLNPSDDDIQTTTQLVRAGKILGVRVLDHLIVSINGIYSIRENYGHLFE